MGFSLRVAALAAAVLVPLACGQSLTVDDTTIDANTSTVAPAADSVSAASSNATTDLFASETLQLTDSVLANLTALNLTSIDLFTFTNGTNETTTADATSKRSLGHWCRSMPGDLLYPSTLVWKIFGLLLGPNVLIKTKPLASPCYTNWGNEDAEKCASITNNWTNDSWMHADDPTSVLWPLYQGRTCMPTNETSDACTRGAYPEYAVAVTNVAQIQLAVNFARNANLRLVIKNTGHDFNGKSAGAGALSIWTHKLKQIQYFASHSEGSYSGPAVKVETGVQAIELYEAANKLGFTAVGGEGRSVGVTGGFMFGGGHSPLSSLYGMAADQILSMEVVLPSGAFVTASNTSHPDLFWALRGGGGGAWGVVTSLTLKVLPRISVTVATFGITGGGNVTEDLFWDAMAAYLKYLPTFVDAGTYSYIQVLNLGSGVYSFKMAPFFGPELTQAEVKTLLAPLFADWEALGVPVAGLTYYDYNNFYDAWWAHFPLETGGVTTLKTASRLFPRSNFLPATNASLFNATVAAIRSTVSQGASVLAFNIGASPSSGYPDNSINPAWRKTVLHAIQAITWDADADDETIAAACLKLTNDWMQTWRDTCPEAGAYMSEGDILEPNFQQAFYGSDVYPRLYAIKQRYDPWGLFYVPTGVGSEDWYITGQIDGLPTQNGRLCPA